MNEIDPVRAEAIDWFIRLRDGGAGDWEAFTTWLEASSAHATAYDAVSLADAEFDMSKDEQFLPYVGANDDDAALSRRPKILAWTGGLGVVAAALGIFLVGPTPRTSADPYVIATVAGEHRTITIADGTRIALNGATRLTLDRKDTRFARLETGEALFSVRHNPEEPFSVSVGDDRIQDVGTVFNVIRRPRSTSVEVAEGSVMFNPDRQAVALAAGQTLHENGDTGAFVVGRKSPEMIGTWQARRLTYLNAPLATVGEDLSRNMGVAISVDPRVATRHFSGVIQIERDPKILAARLSSLLGVDVRQSGKGLIIGTRGRADR